MKAFQHRRFLQLYDVLKTKEDICLIMELIIGEKLFERVINDEFILTERLCELYMIQIYEGVNFMHSCNVIHLDMKVYRSDLLCFIIRKCLQAKEYFAHPWLTRRLKIVSTPNDEETTKKILSTKKNYVDLSYNDIDSVIMCLILAFLFGLYIFYRLYQHFFPTPNINPNGKYVLISGCDTGFGHGLAIELDKQGFYVLAGVYIPDNVITLKDKLSSRATVFSLDITKQEDIDAAFELVKNKTKVLHGLVNNAGIAIVGYIDWTSMEAMRKVMDVNYFGHVAMTKKFLPLLIAKRDSRVVNICSAAGYITSPSLSAYCASKYALESFSDCLRREMFPWRLRVSVIEPGFMRTPIIEGHYESFPNFWNRVSSDVQERWGENFLKTKFDIEKTNPFVKYAEDPMKVVRALQHAVMNTVPCIRYRPGLQSSIIFFPLSRLPDWILDRTLMIVENLHAIPANVSKQLTD
ncbi:unnamed protein product [Rotaria sordida]|uniref:Protein kinase domain-containing protein n=1 Tax=Rotaria sordida TaxID=392033 RepID=A0A819KQX1_9BILA|nr:unnamed protein product [Rotaria sordida]